jgi:hypothetical protein
MSILVDEDKLKAALKEDLDEAIDRLRDEVVAPLLAEMARIRALAARIEGATLTGTVGFQFGAPAPAPAPAPVSVDPGAPK